MPSKLTYLLVHTAITSPFLSSAHTTFSLPRRTAPSSPKAGSMPGRPPFNSRGLIYARVASLQLPRPDPRSGGCPSLPPTGSAACPPLLATAPPSTRGGLREDPRSGGCPSSLLGRIRGVPSIASSGAYIDSWRAMGSIGAVFHGGSPTLPAPPTSTILHPVFPSVPSPRLGIPTSSGHGIHSARKVKAVVVCS